MLTPEGKLCPKCLVRPRNKAGLIGNSTPQTRVGNASLTMNNVSPPAEVQFMGQPDAKLERLVADAIADEMMDGNVLVLDRRDLARRAALQGFRRGLAVSALPVAEWDADEISRQLIAAAERLPSESDER